MIDRVPACFLGLAAAALCSTSALRAPAGDVVISEIHYEPPDNTVSEEFIELHNQGTADVDLSGWFISSGVQYAFPPLTMIPAGGYIVVAEDPQTMSRNFLVSGALGPYVGQLSNEGERIVLRNASGDIEDEVSYEVRFPWPLASAGDGSSMELIHPSLDNDLGGSWRASGLSSYPSGPRVYLLRREDPAWRYRKGTSEASAPATAWRDLDFLEDATWATGQTGIGYADGDDKTVLSDMVNNYTSVYLRHEFDIPRSEDIPSQLKLAHYVDDGCIVWINGVEVARIRVAEGEVPFDGKARAGVEAAWETITLSSPSAFLQVGLNIIAVHAFNVTGASSDFSFDMEIFVPGEEDQQEGVLGPPTPGARNSVYSENAPPQTRQVDHAPVQPAAGADFTVTAKVTDPQGVAAVELRFQVLEPGNYIPAFLPLTHAQLLSNPYQGQAKNPEFEDPSSWTSIPMRDDGTGGDVTAGDDTFAATVPGQVNRALVRYRIVVTDSLGLSATVPHPDDPSLNFACFVHDGVPGYEITRLTIRKEGVGYVYPPDVLQSLPVYFLITRASDLTQCIAADPAIQIPQGTEARFAENWEGAFVYEGTVYDHMRYRLRGANGRYQIPPSNPSNVAGKRHWRFRFNRGRHFEARDKWGNPYPTKWRILNTDRLFGNRLDGNWGLGDEVNDIIWNAHGVPAPFGHNFHWRVISGAEEAPAGADGQYLGDFWGIVRAFENYDGHFLDAHGLPRGNLYKLVNQTNDALAQMRYQAARAVKDGSDHDNIEYQLRPTQPDSWLEAYVNYEEWNRYHAIAQALRHYDYWPDANKNATWYFEPIYTPQNRNLGFMWTLPFDADATWGPTWNDGRDRPYEAIFASPGKPEFQKAYKNAIREVRDLLWQRDQLEQVIRQTAAFMDALEEADIDRWRNAPAAAGRQYFSATAEATLEGKCSDMLNFAFVGGSWPGGSVGAGGRAAFLDSFADGSYKSQLPDKPIVTYTGPAGFPIDGLSFEIGGFSDPQGQSTFAALEWRIARVSSIQNPGSTPLSDPIWRAEPVRLEITPVWKSGEILSPVPEVTIPAAAVEPLGHYRVRARVKDDTNLWSHWSDPIEFQASPALAPVAQQACLRITEIMYHPAGDSDFEFVELQNTGPSPLDLSEVRLTEGIEFCFGEGSVKTIAPGEYVMVVKDLAVFASRYPTQGLLLAGEYEGNLSNAGELIVLTQGLSQTILRFAYDDAWQPSTDGEGHSLVVKDPAAPADSWGSWASWAASRELHGSPGRDEPASTAGLQLPGDVQQDALLNITDPIALLGYLFAGTPSRLPCGDGTVKDPANVRVLDVNGSGGIDLSDCVYLLNFLFLGGPAPAQGRECVPVEGCPSACQW